MLFHNDLTTNSSGSGSLFDTAPLNTNDTIRHRNDLSANNHKTGRQARRTCPVHSRDKVEPVRRDARNGVDEVPDRTRRVI